MSAHTNISIMSKSPNSDNIINSNSMENFVPQNYIQNKELILGKNFFNFFDFFDCDKKNIVQNIVFYHKYGIKIYFNYNPDMLMGNYSYLKIEGSEYHSIYISLDENYNILNVEIVNLCHFSAEIIINSLMYIEKIVLLGEALGIKIDDSFDNIKEKIKYMNYPIVEIKDTECLISNRLLLIDKNFFDILECITPENPKFVFEESNIKIQIIYEISTFFTPMVTFNLKVNNHKFCALCFYFDNQNGYLIKEIYIMYDYPFAVEFILNKIKNVDNGIKLIAEALGIKLDYTENELENMQKYL